MAQFKAGDRIIRVGASRPPIYKGDKMIAGPLTRNGHFVLIDNRIYTTRFFKPLITCWGKAHETHYN